MSQTRYKYGETLKHLHDGEIIFRGYHMADDVLYTLKHVSKGSLRIGKLSDIIVTPKKVDVCEPTPIVGRTYRSKLGTYEGVAVTDGRIRITKVLGAYGPFYKVGEHIPFTGAGFEWLLQPEECEPTVAKPIVGQRYKSRSSSIGTYEGVGMDNGMVRITKLHNLWGLRKVGECVSFDPAWGWKPIVDECAPLEAVAAKDIIPGKLYKSMPSGDYTAVALHECDANGHRKMMLTAVANPLLGKIGSIIPFHPMPWRAL